MSKRTRSGGNEPTAKCQCRIGTVNQTVQSALYDNGAWEILKQFLTTSMSLSEMDDTLHLLFYGDDDNDESLRVLTALWKTYILDPPTQMSVHRSPSKRDSHLSSSRIKRSHKSNKHKNIYLLDEAEEGDDDKEGHEEGMSVWLLKVMRMQGPSAKQRLAATFDNMASWFKQNSQSCKDRTHRAPESRMYLLDVQRTVVEYIADHLCKKKFPVTLSAWVAGQLYVVADSPKTIAHSLPLSLYAAVKKYSHITDEERGAVERS
ncbi:hypothetical protein EDD22DRAFT_848661 [Suillus occidentalis]|nr:hypothetical protein EDD22DRAFT_848661 [Suillus occidentalis]